MLPCALEFVIKLIEIKNKLSIGISFNIFFFPIVTSVRKWEIKRFNLKYQNNEKYEIFSNPT